MDATELEMGEERERVEAESGNGMVWVRECIGGTPLDRVPAQSAIFLILFHGDRYR